MPVSQTITVVGGGAVAAAAALAAADSFHVHYYTPSAAASGGGRHYALSRRSLSFLTRLGLVLQPFPVRRFQLHAGGRCLTLADSDRPLCWMLAEEALTQAFQLRLQQTALTARPYQTIQRQDSADTGIQLAIDGQPHPGGATALLAVADGARSPLATELGIIGTRIDFEQQAVVAQVTTSALEAGTAAQWFGDNDIVALLPSGDHIYSLVWSTACPPPAAEAEEQLRRRIGIECLTVDNSTVRQFPLTAVKRPVRVVPHAALLGDAAGTIHPLAGQGLNLGLGDVETLFDCIRRRTPVTLPLGLAAYNIARGRRQRQLHQITTHLLADESRTARLLTLARLPLAQRFAIAYANA